MHPRGGSGDRQRRDQVADAPARHRVGLREGLAVDQPVAQFLNRQRGDEWPVVEDDVVVRLIGEDEQIVPRGDAPEPFQFIAPEDDAGRVARVAEHDHLRAAGRRVDGVEIEMEVGGRGDEDGLRARQLDEVGVERVGRLRQQHALAGVDRREQRGGERGAPAVRDDDLGRFDRVPAHPRRLLGERRAQLRIALPIRVVGVAALDRLDQRPADVVGRREVRVARRERDVAGAGARRGALRLGDDALNGCGRRKHLGCLLP